MIFKYEFIRKKKTSIEERKKMSYLDHSRLVFVLIVKKFNEITEIIELFEIRRNNFTKWYRGLIHLKNEVEKEDKFLSNSL